MYVCMHICYVCMYLYQHGLCGIRHNTSGARRDRPPAYSPQPASPTPLPPHPSHHVHPYATHHESRRHLESRGGGGIARIVVPARRVRGQGERGGGIMMLCLVPYIAAHGWKLPYNLVGSFHLNTGLFLPNKTYILARDLLPAMHGVLVLVAYSFLFCALRRDNPLF